MNNLNIIEQCQASPALGAATLLGVIVVTLLAFQPEHTLLNLVKTLVYLRVSLCFRLRSLPLDLKYAYLQFLRFKFWLIHGIDVMDETPNGQAMRRPD